MRLSTRLLALSLASVGCSDAGATLLAPDDLQMTFQWAENRYPTEEEFALHGGSPSTSATDPTGSFTGMSFGAASTIALSWVNVARADLRVQLINQSGSTVNSGSDRFEVVQYRPFSGTAHLGVALSTNGNNCGLVGKSSVEVRGEFHVLRLHFGSWRPLELWSEEYTRPGSDVFQGACDPPPPCNPGGPDPIFPHSGGDGASFETTSCSPGGGGNPGSGGGFYRCYTLDRHHYWYYPDTKTWEYRYTETFEWCEYHQS